MRACRRWHPTRCQVHWRYYLEMPIPSRHPTPAYGIFDPPEKPRESAISRPFRTLPDGRAGGTGGRIWCRRGTHIVEPAVSAAGPRSMGPPETAVDHPRLNFGGFGSGGTGMLTPPALATVSIPFPAPIRKILKALGEPLEPPPHSRRPGAHRPAGPISCRRMTTGTRSRRRLKTYRSSTFGASDRSAPRAGDTGRRRCTRAKPSWPSPACEPPVRRRPAPAGSRLAIGPGLRTGSPPQPEVANSAKAGDGFALVKQSERDQPDVATTRWALQRKLLAHPRHEFRPRFSATGRASGALQVCHSSRRYGRQEARRS
jgi:hypothetical protein